MKRIRALGLIAAALLAVHPAAAEWEADADDKLQVKAARALDDVRERLPRMEPFYEQAYGYAIYPSVTRFGIGFGGAYGKGIVVEGTDVIGTTKFWQFTSGIQAGAKNFSMVIFFKDKEALDFFKAKGVEFMGQAGVAFGTVGAAGTPAYNDGVAIATVTRLGLMGEFSYSGATFTFKPAAEKP